VTTYAAPTQVAQKTVPVQTMLVNVRAVGMLRLVHVMPSGDVAAPAVVPSARAANTVPFHATHFHVREVKALAVQVIPSGEVAAP